jgi:hypothetical protein
MDASLYLMAKDIGHAGLDRVSLNKAETIWHVGVAQSVSQVVVSTPERDWCFPLTPES